MCGIVGLLSLGPKAVLPEELREMSMAIEHRGPDEDGFYLGTDVRLGMRGLSIIDLKSVRQPTGNQASVLLRDRRQAVFRFRNKGDSPDARGRAQAQLDLRKSLIFLSLHPGCREHRRGNSQAGTRPHTSGVAGKAAAHQALLGRK